MYCYIMQLKLYHTFGDQDDLADEVVMRTLCKLDSAFDDRGIATLHISEDADIDKVRAILRDLGIKIFVGDKIVEA
jgi:hypothetical protein